jgi:hypothetical protein
MIDDVAHGWRNGADSKVAGISHGTVAICDHNEQSCCKMWLA